LSSLLANPKYGMYKTPPTLDYFLSHPLQQQDISGDFGNADNHANVVKSSAANDGFSKEFEFKKLLFLYLRLSKDHEDVTRGAANAITILNRAGMSLSGKDLSRVSINNADLSHGVFDMVNFSNADLTGVNFTRSWLRNTIFNNSTMTDVKFSEYPFLHLNLEGNLTDMKICWSKIGVFAVTHKSTIHLYKQSSMTLITTLQGHDKNVLCLAFSPTNDNLASGAEDNVICIWSIRNKRLIEKLQGHSREIRSVAFNCTGNILASGGRDNTIRIWDLTGAKKVRVLAGHTKQINALEFSPTNSHKLLSAGLDCSIHLWDVTTGSIIGTFEGHTRSIMALAFSPNGEQFVSGSQDYNIVLWNISDIKDERGKGCILRSNTTHSTTSHSGWVSSLSFRPRESENSYSHELISGGYDNIVCVWDIAKRRLIGKFGGHLGQINTVCYMYNRPGICVSGSADGTIRFWNLSNMDTPYTIQYHQRHKGSVRSVSLAKTPDGDIILASAGDDMIIYLWNVNTGNLLRHFEGGNTRHTERITVVVFSPDASLLASGSRDNTIKLWDPVSRNTNYKAIKTITDHTSVVACMAFNSDGTKFASGSFDKTVRVWRVVNKELVSLYCLQGEGRVISLAFSPRKNLLVSGSGLGDCAAWLWDLDTGKQLHRFPPQCKIASSSAIHCVAFSPVSDRLVLAEEEDIISVWNLDTYELLWTSDTAPPISMAFIPGTSIFAVSNFYHPQSPPKSQICLWDANRAKTDTAEAGTAKVDTVKCLSIIEGFPEYVQSISFLVSGNQSLLATAGDNGCIKLWKIQNTQPEIKINLVWSTDQDSLNVHNAFFDAVEGLSESNCLLLKQLQANISSPRLDSIGLVTPATSEKTIPIQHHQEEPEFKHDERPISTNRVNAGATGVIQEKAIDDTNNAFDSDLLIARNSRLEKLAPLHDYLTTLPDIISVSVTYDPTNTDTPIFLIYCQDPYTMDTYLSTNSRVPDFKYEILRPGDMTSFDPDMEPPVINLQEYEDMFEAFEEADQTLFQRHSNITMITIGYSYYMEDDSWSKDPQIIVYVYPKGRIPWGEELLPKTIKGKTVKILEGLCMQCVEPEATGEYKYVEPVCPGVSIGPYQDGQTGTLGGFLTCAKGEAYFITNCHVVDPTQCFFHPKNCNQPDIQQPGPIDLDRYLTECNDKTQPNKLINRLSQEISSLFRLDTSYTIGSVISKTFHNIQTPYKDGTKLVGLDLAVCKYKSQRKHDPDPKIRKYKYNPRICRLDDESRGTEVVKRGRTTGVRDGYLQRPRGSVAYFTLGDHVFDRKRAGTICTCPIVHTETHVDYKESRTILHNQYIIRGRQGAAFGDKGDSGSVCYLVENDEIRPIGLYHSKMGDMGVASPIDAVMTYLKYSEHGELFQDTQFARPIRAEISAEEKRQFA
jgi:WD40 repeat protein